MDWLDPELLHIMGEKDLWLDIIGYWLDDPQIFVDQCKSGNMTIIKYLHKSMQPSSPCSNITLLSCLNNALISCCECNQLPVVQWLHSMGADILVLNELGCNKILINCCKNNNLDIAQWLLSVCVDIHTSLVLKNRSRVFIQCCQSNSLEVAQWLRLVACIDIHAHYDATFAMSCAWDSLQVAQWLYSFGINPNEYDLYQRFKRMNRSLWNQNTCSVPRLRAVTPWLRSLGVNTSDDE